ncbi:MAG: hypothetical protein KF799_01610 [Bdellovibrionales bacterium]|nr:hypothetical protein [Bdellovibrionales bacterium]
MSNLIEIRILLPEHKEALLAFGLEQLEREISDPMEREMQSWSARWRGEALDHYLSMGWSYGAFNGENHITGFILAQPFIFMRGLTQTLWVEHFAFSDAACAQALLDTTYKWARDKHFQCVLIEEHPESAGLLRDWKQACPVKTPLIELRTARF